MLCTCMLLYVCVKCREVKQQWPAGTVTETHLKSVQSAANADSSGSAMSSSREGSPSPLERSTAVTLPSASLLMSELLTHQREEQRHDHQQHPVTVTGRSNGAADTGALASTRCASPGLLTDITSLLASYQNF